MKGQVELGAAVLAIGASVLLVSGGLAGFFGHYFMSDAQEKYNICKDNLTKLQQENKELQERIGELEEDYRSCQQRKSNLGGRLGSLNETIDTKEDKIENLSDRIDNLEGKLESKNQKINNLKNRENTTININELDRYRVSVFNKEVNLMLFFALIIPIDITLFGLSGLFGIWQKNIPISVALAILGIIPWLIPILA
jgi:predicted nuclease with TOPRIM domain